MQQVPFASAISSRDDDGVGRFFNFSRSDAFIRDTITATWLNTGASFAGSMSFDFDLLGAVDQGADGSARASAGASINGVSVFSYDSVVDGSLDSVTTSSRIELLGGSTSLVTFAIAEARTTNLPEWGVTYFSSSDLGSSLRITGLSFFDFDGNDVTSSLNVVSEPGFDYVTGANPHDRDGSISPVPLPASA